MKAIPRRLIGEADSAPDFVPVFNDREALRALVAEADHLGVDPDGASWLLIRTTRELVDYLAHLDAERADDEPDDFGEDCDPKEDGGDDERDDCDREQDGPPQLIGVRPW